MAGLFIELRLSQFHHTGWRTGNKGPEVLSFLPESTLTELLKSGYALCGLTGLLYYGAGTSTLILLGRSLQQPWLSASLTLASLGLGMFGVASIAYLTECVSDSLKGTISGAYYVFWGLGYFLAPGCGRIRPMAGAKCQFLPPGGAAWHRNHLIACYRRR